jgi:hypothetical protein
VTSPSFPTRLFTSRIADMKTPYAWPFNIQGVHKIRNK